MERKEKDLHKDQSKTLWTKAFALLLVCTSCSVEQEFNGSSHLRTAFSLTSPAAMDGRITIAEAYLKLDRIEVSGSLSGNNNTSLTHAIPAEEPPYNLTQADSSRVNFPLSSRAYDQLDLHLFPFTDAYELVYLNSPVEEPPVEEPEEEQSGDNSANEAENQDAGNDSTGGGNDDDNGDGGSNDGTGGNDNGADNGEDPGDNSNDDADDGPGEDDEDEDEDDDSKDDKKDKGEKDKDKDHKKKKKDKDKDGQKNDDDNDDDDRGDDDDDRDGDSDDDDDRGDRKSANGNTPAVDLDHFFRNAKPGLVVFGIYENNGKVINVIVVVTDLEKITVRAKQDDSFSIRLAENNTARLSFDPAYWFESLTPQDIEDGIIQVYQQQNMLFIHPHHNTALYQALVSRLEGSADLQISKADAQNF